VSLIAAYDIDERALNTCGQRWNVKHLYNDIDEMLDEHRFDIISISSPPHTHLPIIKTIAKKGQVPSVLLEKPLAANLKEAKSVHNLIVDSEIKAAVNYIRRFPPIYRQVERELQRGKYGKIRHIRVCYTKGILNNASHAIDLLCFYFGEVKDVEYLGEGVDLSSSDPTLSFRLDFQSDVTAWFFGLDHKDYNIFEIDILGTQGRLRFSDLGHVLEYFPVQETRSQHGFRQLDSESSSQPTDLSRAVFYAVDDLITAIEQDTTPLCTIKDGYAAQEIALSATEKFKEIQ